MSDDFKYWAFISYSSRDRAWGEWLHRTLETYRVPKALAGLSTLRGEPVPKRVYPVFRDRDELPTNADLGEMIHRALEQSRYLIVICSPPAAQSRWVNKEILEYKRLGRENRVLAVIVDGEPNASDGKPGVESAAECFPPALRFRLDANGELSKERTEPIAADAREHGDGRANALLKLLAGVLGVNYDDLKRRDEERRRRRQRVVVSISSALVLAFAVLAGTATWQWREAERQRQEAERQKREVQITLSNADFSVALERLDKNNIAEATAFLCRALRVFPQNHNAASLLFSVLSSQDWPLPETRFRPNVDGARILAVERDTQRVVVAAADHAARIWSLSTGQAVSAPMQHRQEITAAAFSLDGRRVVTASEDWTARVWDATTGEPVSAPMLHDHMVWSAAFSPDGSRVVTFDDSNTAWIWDAATGRRCSAPMHVDNLLSARFTPDGRRVLTVGVWTVQLWDASTGQSLPAAIHDGQMLEAATISPDGEQIVTVDGGTIRSWQATSGQLLASFLHDLGQIDCVSFSADGKWAAIASRVNMRQHAAQIFSLTTGRPVSIQVPHEELIMAMSFSDNGRLVATASFDQTARVWDATTGKFFVRPISMHHEFGVDSVLFSADGSRVITLSDSTRTAQIWDVIPAQSFFTPLPHRNEVSTASFSANGTRIITISAGNSAQIWEAVSGHPVSDSRSYEGKIMASVRIGPDGWRVLAVVGKAARIWDVVSGRPVAPPMDVGSETERASFSPDGGRVVTVSKDPPQTVRVWDATSGRLISSFIPKGGEIDAASISADGRRVLTVTNNLQTARLGTAQLWDADSGQPVSAPMSHEAVITSAALSRDGRRLVTTSYDETARVWDVARGQPVFTTARGGLTVQSAIFAPDDDCILTVSGEADFNGPASFGIAQLWDAGSGRLESVPMRNPGGITSARFSPDGRQVITASYFGAVRIWDAATGRLISVFEPHYLKINSAEFSPDGGHVVSASNDKTAQVWPVCRDMGPEWVLDVAEALIQRRLDNTGALVFYEGKPLDGLRQQARQEPLQTHPLVVLAKRILKVDQPGSSAP